MKVGDKKRVFKENWRYFFIEHNEKPVCLETVAVNKEYNLKCHHETISELKGIQRKEKKVYKSRSKHWMKVAIFKTQRNLQY